MSLLSVLQIAYARRLPSPDLISPALMLIMQRDSTVTAYARALIEDDVILCLL